MNIRAYTNEDFSELNDWYRARGAKIQERYLPQYGFIVEGIAAGFLMQTDCPVCFLEPFISNPSATKHDRDRALNLILNQLVSLARLQEYELIYGVSTSKTMVDRSINTGFQIQDISTVVRYKL